ncbi:MAG: phosphoserine phosphatase SerB [Verrucomicrobiota bacterium]
MTDLVLQGTTAIAPHLAALEARVGGPGRVLPDPRAARFAAPPHPEAAWDYAREHRLDVALVPPGRRLSDFRLCVMDMDSTLITIECIDEIADLVGVKPQVAAITGAAMRGELDFPGSLRRRVALLAGLPEAALQRVYDERLRLSPGAAEMLAGMRAAGLETLLVSGGFTFFTSRLQERLGLHHTLANILRTRDGRLTGEVEEPLVDATAKAQAVVATCARLGCGPERALVIGDGANDLQMMAVAGVSIAYHAKPVVQREATHAINCGGLDAVLKLFAPAIAPAASADSQAVSRR